MVEIRLTEDALLHENKNNKTEGTPIPKLAMVKRLKVKKNSEKSKIKKKIITKIHHQNSSSKFLI